MQKEWNAIAHIIPQEALSIIVGNRFLYLKNQLDKADVSLKLGLFMNLISQYNCSGRYDVWSLLKVSEFIWIFQKQLQKNARKINF